jgi:hypothetical protein
MKTEDFIEMLATNLEPVRGGQLRKTLFIAMAVAVVAAGASCFTWCMLTMPAMPIIPTMPADAMSWWHFCLTAIALVFTLGLAAVGARVLFRSARPGLSARRPLILMGMLFLVMVSAAIVALAIIDPAARSTMILGGQGGTCLICIPMFAVIPFVAFIWALRKGAPTHLAFAGAIAGLVAGALGAAAVVVNQTADSLPLIALWYGAPVALCALIGGILGPRLLRW